MNESQRKRLDDLMRANPNRVPIIMETKPPLETPTHSKLLVPDTYTVAQTLITFRRFMPALKPSQAVFAMIDHVLVPNSALVSQLFKEYGSPDGVLHIHLRAESAFG